MRSNFMFPLAAAVSLSLAMPATAEFKVRYPDAETGEFATPPLATSLTTQSAPTVAN